MIKLFLISLATQLSLSQDYNNDLDYFNLRSTLTNVYNSRKTWMPKVKKFFFGQNLLGERNDYSFEVPTKSDWRWVIAPKYSIKNPFQYHRFLRRDPDYFYGYQRTLPLMDSNRNGYTQDRKYLQDPSISAAFDKMRAELNDLNGEEIQMDNRQ